MGKKRRLCVFLDQRLYEAIEMIAEYNAYNDVSEFVRAVLRSFLVELLANKVVVRPVAALPRGVDILGEAGGDGGEGGGAG